MKIQNKKKLGGGGGGVGSGGGEGGLFGQGRCEQRSEVFVKFLYIYFFLGGGVGQVGGSQGGCEQRIEVLMKI